MVPMKVWRYACCIWESRILYDGKEGYKLCLSVANQTELIDAIKKVQKHEKPCFIEINATLGSRDDLGRPTTTPKRKQKALMSYLIEGEMDS